MDHKSTLHKNQDVRNEPGAHHTEANSSTSRARITPPSSFFLLQHLVDMYQIDLETSHPDKQESGRAESQLCTTAHLQSPAKATCSFPKPEHVGSAKPSETDSFFSQSNIKQKPPASLHHPHLIHQTAKTPPPGTELNKSLPGQDQTCGEQLGINETYAKQALGQVGGRGGAAGWDLNHHSDSCFYEITSSTFQRPYEVLECNPLTG